MPGQSTLASRSDGNRRRRLLRSSGVARFDVQTFAERGKRRFDLIQTRVAQEAQEREQALNVGPAYPDMARNCAFLRPEFRNAV